MTAFPNNSCASCRADSLLDKMMDPPRCREAIILSAQKHRRHWAPISLVNHLWLVLVLRSQMRDVLFLVYQRIHQNTLSNRHLTPSICVTTARSWRSPSGLVIQPIDLDDHRNDAICNAYDLQQESPQPPMSSSCLEVSHSAELFRGRDIAR